MKKLNKKIWFWLLYILVFVSACQNSIKENRPNIKPDEFSSSTRRKMIIDSNSKAIELHCQPLYDGTEQLSVQIAIHNNSDEMVYLPVTNRMPYVLMQEDKSLLILYGVEPPEPNINYLFIEIPKTQALEPNEVFEAEVPLVPLYIGGHYSLSRFRSTPKEWHGLTTVHCQVGWGETPILPRKEEQNVRNIDEFMEWQQITTAEPIQVTFP